MTQYFHITPGHDGSPQFHIWGWPLVPEQSFRLGPIGNIIETTDMIVDMGAGDVEQMLRTKRDDRGHDRRGRKVWWE